MIRNSLSLRAALSNAPRGRLTGLVAHGRHIAKFGLVGGSGVILNTAILYLLVDGAGWPHLEAAVISTEAAILSNFVLNDCWTFREAVNRGSWLWRLWRYNAIALGGFVISLVVLAVLTLGFGAYYLLANLVGIALATLWNYAVNVRCTWLLHCQIYVDDALPPTGQAHPLELIALEDH